MSRPRNPVPTYRRHPSGQAICQIIGPTGRRNTIYLGPFGSPESYAEYRKLIANLESGLAPEPRASALTVSHLGEAFLTHADPVSPEKRFFRPFVIVCVTFLFLACVGGAELVLIVTREPLLGVPMVAIAAGPSLLIRWTMIWLSTPDERKLLADSIGQSPVAAVRELFSGVKKAGRDERPLNALHVIALLFDKVAIRFCRRGFV